MEYISLVVSLISLIVLVVNLIIVLKNKNNANSSITDKDLKDIKKGVSESVNELSNMASQVIATKNSALMDKLDNQVNSINKNIDSLINKENEFEKDTLHQKEEIMNKLSSEIAKFNSDVKETFKEFKNDTNNTIKELNETVNRNLKEIREDNQKKLEEINASVNEKLQKTLEDKLNESFKSVAEGLNIVTNSMGEIKGLASDVGSLKNVLTNVKTKGIMGEVILGNIIKDVLTVGQYEENVVTKKGSNERVEFALILPGTKDDKIYLPVDSKFPYEDYSTIQNSSSIEEINEARKKLRSSLLKYASDVNEKYIDAPNTTDFAIIFLPLEGLYLEALNMGLFEEIQSKYKVNLTGPTTFTAFINALNMGFRSLMIQKKSADVFKLLGAVKTEFGKFADALEKTQKKVNAAADELDSLVGTRTKMMNSKLKQIDALDEETTKALLEDK